jgi:hypothetical protein
MRTVLIVAGDENSELAMVMTTMALVVMMRTAVWL